MGVFDAKWPILTLPAARVTLDSTMEAVQLAVSSFLAWVMEAPVSRGLAARGSHGRTRWSDTSARALHWLCLRPSTHARLPGGPSRIRGQIS